jgi:exodeoxyribonuclease-3
LKQNPCDIVLLQELKCVEENFPYEAFEDLNYNIALYGQPTYNGVAVLSKTPIQTICKGIPGFHDVSARYLECFTNEITVACIYVPNGGEVNSDKYLYKLDFLKHLKHYLKQRIVEENNFLLGGDFNVALNDDDVFNPIVLNDQTCFTKQERLALKQILDVGFLDALRLSIKEQVFTWWDYRGGAFPKNHGMRLDYIFLSSGLVKQFDSTFVDKSLRFLEKPSDHIPVISTLKDNK